jgi:hypothetical protein
MKCENSRSTGLDHRDYINHRDTENIKQEINKYSKQDRETKEGNNNEERAKEMRRLLVRPAS